MNVFRVLLVEDDDADALLLREHLDDVPEQPHDLVHVRTLDQARELAAAGRFDVVLLDLDLGTTSGVATVDAARDAVPDTPVVVLSGVTDRELARQCVGRGAEDHLVKGRVDGDQVARAIAHAVERFRARTEVGRLLAEKEEVTRRLDRLRVMHDEFVAVASHELRTPVTIAAGFVDVLAERDDLLTEEQRRAYVERARRALDRLRTLTDDLLTVSRIGAGGAVPARRDLRLGALVDEVAAATDLGGDELVVDVADDVVVSADPLHLTQVLRNLLDNATRHGHPPVAVTGQRARDHVELVVRDHGPGVPSSFADRLFDRFAQADASTSRPHGGTGLGLAIVRGLVEAGGGAVAHETPDDGGALFRLELPTGERSHALD